MLQKTRRSVQKPVQTFRISILFYH